MSRFRVTPLRSITIREEGEAEELPVALEDRVSAIWRAEGERRGNELYDAPLFNVTRVEGPDLSGHFVPYRRWIAQLRDPELRQSLAIQPGAVCALSFAREAMLLGRRSESVTQDPGAWEPIPAGSIGIGARGVPDAGGEGMDLDPQAQLLEELHEELHVARDRVTRIEPLALVVDRETGVHDVAFTLELDLSVEEVEVGFRARNTREVSAFCGVPRNEVSQWLRSMEESVAPITHSLLAAWERQR